MATEPRCLECELPESICDCSICIKCGDVAYEYDEATEFCATCYEHEMGEPLPC